MSLFLDRIEALSVGCFGFSFPPKRVLFCPLLRLPLLRLYLLHWTVLPLCFLFAFAVWDRSLQPEFVAAIAALPSSSDCPPAMLSSCTAVRDYSLRRSSLPLLRLYLFHWTVLPLCFRFAFAVRDRSLQPEFVAATAAVPFSSDCPPAMLSFCIAVRDRSRQPEFFLLMSAPDYIRLLYTRFPWLSPSPATVVTCCRVWLVFCSPLSMSFDICANAHLSSRLTSWALDTSTC